LTVTVFALHFPELDKEYLEAHAEQPLEEQETQLASKREQFKLQTPFDNE